MNLLRTLKKSDIFIAIPIKINYLVSTQSINKPE
jgi:hypothetical protein